MEIYYSGHSKQRAALRFINHEEVINSLKNGTCFHSEQEKGVYTCIHEKNKIVFRVDMKQDILVVITVMPSPEFNKELKRYARKNNISITKATKKLRGVA
jgi:hypothetical protein